jgi:GDP-mannose 6-dehydrogenase
VSSLLNADFDDVIDNSDVIILGNRDEKFRALVQNVPRQAGDRPGRLHVQGHQRSGRTEGICW